MVTYVLLAIALVIGAFAYRQSERFKAANGVTPWRLPSLLWALIGFLSLLLWAILFVIARRTTTVPAGGATMSAAPGWHPDPSGRYQYRYWDGSSWTDQVSTKGVSATDPM